jgi:hypothetical protein
MARLLIRTKGVGQESLELKLGSNSVGRSSDADFSINHPTVSGLHCELVLGEEGVAIRDLESTNGTFIDGKQIRESRLHPGQVVRLGNVELLVESTHINVNIPKFINTELPAPPVVSVDGAVLCPRHPQARVTHRCPHCHEVMCELCIHRLRRKGSRTLLLLCPVCSHSVESLSPAQIPKRKSFLARVGETVRMKLTRTIHGANR